MNDQGQENTMRDMMPSSFSDSKLSKATELNSSMSVASTGNDELTNKLRGGVN